MALGKAIMVSMVVNVLLIKAVEILGKTFELSKLQGSHICYVFAKIIFISKCLVSAHH